MSAAQTDIKNLVNKMFEKDSFTRKHSIDVYNLVFRFYNNLPCQLMSNINREKLFCAAILHDIGKLLVPDSILNKPGALSSDEREIIKSHAAKGKLMLDITEFREISDIVCYHHERIDGKGYFGLERNSIPLESKIIAIADTYSALTEDRIYRKRCSTENAMKVLREACGAQLDSELVDIFCCVA